MSVRARHHPTPRQGFHMCMKVAFLIWRLTWRDHRCALVHPLCTGAVPLHSWVSLDIPSDNSVTDLFHADAAVVLDGQPPETGE